MHRLLIMGELHTSEERTRVNAMIRNSRWFRSAPRMLLLEDLGVFNFKYPMELFPKGIKLSKPVVERLKLANRLQADAIGIDVDPIKNKNVFSQDRYDKDGTPIDLTRSFAIRESLMLNIIKASREAGDCIIVLGDTHLRTIVTKSLGPVSPIHVAFRNDPRATIIRSPIKEID